MSLTYNWEIVGHDKVLRQLEADMAQASVSHAYLFSGPDSTGKFSAAKRMAHILQCEQSFCGECSTCQEITKGYHADTIEMADNGESVKIEEVRKVLERLYMSSQSPYKVFLLQNIERMTIESSNALLKTLEDPPGNVIFLLTTSRVKEVIPTILSRVRMAKFGRLSDEVLVALLKEAYPLVEEDVISTVSAATFGRPGKALALLGDREMYDRYRKMYEDIEMFLRAPNRVDQFLYIEELTKVAKEEGRHVLTEFLDIFQLVLRKQLLLDVQGERGIFSREKLVRLLEEVHKAQGLLGRNVNSRLLLENMMLSL